jgi:energy-converting hydrogenase Eha subunit H
MPITIRMVPAMREGVTCSPKMRTLRMAVTRGYVAAIGTISEVAPALKAAKYVIIPIRPASIPLILKITMVLKSTASVSLSFPVKTKNKKSTTITAMLLMVTAVNGWTLVNPIFSMIGVVPQRMAVNSKSRRIFI